MNLPITDNALAVEELADRVEVNTDNSVSWFGEIAVPPVRVADELVVEALQSHIADIVYSAHYVFGTPRPISGIKNDVPVLSSNADFVRELVSAHRGERLWLPSFEEESESELTLWGVRYLKPKLSPEDLGHRLPTVLPMRSPGFVLFIGDQGARVPESTEDSTFRVYWNISQTSAPTLVTELTKALNEHGEPFQLKVAHNASSWPERADVAVLYLPMSRLVARWETILEIYEGLRAEVRHWTPAFTRRIASGLAIAEDPPGGLSFGQAIARILARGISEDNVRNGDRSNRATRVEHMRNALAASGRGIESAHLNPGSTEPAITPLLDRQSVGRPSGSPAASQPRRGSVANRAEEIADLVAELAITADGRCAWLAHSADSKNPADLETVGAELYDGLAGISLFLAHSRTVLGNGRHIGLAEMAALSAMDRLHEVDHQHGLYGGRAGAAAAVAAVGRTLGRSDIQELATEHLLDAADETGDEPLDHDLIYGVSGSVLAYCWAAQTAASDDSKHRLLDRAKKLGHALACRVESDLGGSAAKGVLPGLAHGPSSSALAFATLSLLSGGDDLLDRAAAVATDHERRHYDHDAANWPGGPSGIDESRFNWCYGAPGIAVARLASTGPAAAADLAAAVRGTIAAGPRFLGHSADASTCHGKLSIVGVLDLLQRSTGLPVDTELRESLLHEALDHYSEKRATRFSPGLMTGAAGAGLAALRHLAPDTVPSPLFPLLLPERT